MGIFDKIKKALGWDDPEENNNAGNAGSNPTEKTGTPKPKSGSNPQKSIHLPAEGDIAQFEQLILQSCEEYKKNHTHFFFEIKVTELSGYQEWVSKWTDAQKVAFIVYAGKRLKAHQKKIGNHGNFHNGTGSNESWMARAFVNQLLKTKILLEDADIAQIYSVFIHKNQGSFGWYFGWSLSTFLNLIANNHKQKPVSAALQATLRQIKGDIEAQRQLSEDKERTKLIAKIDGLLFQTTEGGSAVKPVRFMGEDAFAEHANPFLDNLSDADAQSWYPLVAMAQKASGSKPSAKYLNTAKELMTAIGTEKVKRVLGDWFTFVIQHKEIQTQSTYTYGGHEYTVNNYFFLTCINLDALKGLAWMCANFHDTQTIQTIAKLAERSFKKIPGVGSASVALGNACLFVLFKSKGLEGISHLSRLRLRIKQASTQTLIDNYLEEAAKQKGISVAEIEDIAVDDFGLQEGRRTWQFDDFRFELEVVGPGKTMTTWRKADGNTQKSEPASVKASHAAKLKKMKSVVKQIEQASTAQRDRLDRMFRTGRAMSWAYFQERYFDHGLLGFFARRLIWRFYAADGHRDGLWFGGNWVDAKGMPIEPPITGNVSLWHPALADVDEVRAWRTFLMKNQLLQPMKQAFREVYLLTEAEMNTRLYSNRMAAHILRQHQFNSLAKTRGWSYALQGGFDNGRDADLASLEMPEYGLRVEYWINPVMEDQAMNDTGIWNYVSTDQVRFLSQSNGEPVQLVDIPAIPFSEAMRDVDLFVGVASVGNDPNWIDSGGAPTYRTYWQSYSFGDLGEVAKMRKEILTGLVPRLKIKSVAHIEGNFLVVKGKLRTYKIHIGSGNILMEPNDQYLCIVAARGAKTGTENVFLPFEGDTVLSIVLSKALMLADDDKITDSTITSQIRRG